MTKQDKINFWNEIWNLIEEKENFTCEDCPYFKECEEKEYYWGCPHWEDAMGDDL